MALPRRRLLELYPDDDVDEPFPEAPVTPGGRRRLALLERASWCLATGQPYAAWLELTVDERNAFIDAVNARAVAARRNGG
jgi:hypothetical protein